MSSRAPGQLAVPMTDDTTQNTTSAASATTGPVLVLGATGKTGRRVAARLRAAGREVRAASRSGEVRFDWTDRTTWAPALAGATALYLVAPPEPDPIADFVAQAEAAGVRRFVVLSGRGIERYDESFDALTKPMAEAERAVREAGVDWTVIRPNNFAQNFTEDPAFRAPVLEGRLALPAGAVAEPFIDVEDIADVVVALLGEDGHTGRVYELSGPRALTFDEAVAEISRVTGREVRYEALTPERFVAEQTAAGVPEDAARALGDLFVFLSRGYIASVTSHVEDIIGRAPRDFGAYVKSAAAEGAWTPAE